MVDVFAAWCSPCQEMDREVYSRGQFADQIAKDFIALRKNGEEGEGLAIAGKYHVVGVPTLLVLDGEGREVDRVMGSLKMGELVDTLRGFRAGKGTLGSLELEVATRHAMRGDPRTVLEMADIVKDRARAPQALLTLGKYYYLRGQKNAAEAAKTLEEIVRSYPDAEEAGEAPYSLALAYHQLGRDREARQVLDAWLAQDRDGTRVNGYAWLCFKNNFERARGIEVAKSGLAKAPANDGLWDTLAELYFSVGDRPQAVLAEKKARTLKPNDNYYATQLARFTGEAKK